MIHIDAVFVIIAAGKSSRFGGYPKAFCRLGEQTNIDNTIRLAKTTYQKIYAVINEETYAAGYGKGMDANVIPIVTGQGDADSVLKAIKRIRVMDPTTELAVVCWGDAVFVDETPFREMQRYTLEWDTYGPALVGCCWDYEPYAWFDTNENCITHSFFQKESGVCPKGLHDQSIFAFHLVEMADYLQCYKKQLGLDIYDEDTYDSARGEMKLLNAFAWFYEQPDMEAAEFRLLTENKVKSFNTTEELRSILTELRLLRSQGEMRCCE